MLKKLNEMPKKIKILIITIIVIIISILAFVLEIVDTSVTKFSGSNPCIVLTDKVEKLNCLLDRANLNEYAFNEDEIVLDGMFDRSAGVFGSNFDIPAFKVIGVDSEGNDINVPNDTVSSYLSKKIIQCTVVADVFDDVCPVELLGWTTDDDRTKTVEIINNYINEKL